MASISDYLGFKFLQASFDIPASREKFEVYERGTKYFNGFSEEMRKYIQKFNESIKFNKYPDDLQSIYEQ